MLVNGKHYRTVWIEDDQEVVKVIDQRPLPHKFVIEELRTTDEVATAIRDMHIRGAGCIGAVAGYGMYIGVLEALKLSNQDHLITVANKLNETRPTAVNLAWAIDLQMELIKNEPFDESLKEKVLKKAHEIADFDSDSCLQIGKHGLELIKEIAAKKPGETINVLTHCNAGWLAFVDHGTALSPVFEAKRAGIPIHVWVDETRPRNQGARLTAWELVQENIPHTVISDNTGGHLMQHGLVDMVITGSDRTTRCGDVANKIGTYLKALAAKDNNIPFFAALPSSTIDWNLRDGVTEIPIEERGASEVTHIQGKTESGEITFVQLTHDNSNATNFGFDVTPARLVTKIITERGICDASEESLTSLFPEFK